jgi:hypothetical protein
MLHLVNNDPMASRKDAQVLFLNGFIGKTVRQGLFGGKPHQNAPVRRQVLEERIDQAVMRFQNRALGGCSDYEFDAIFVVGDQEVNKFSAVEIARRLRDRGIPTSHLETCGDAGRMVESVDLFYQGIKRHFYGRKLLVHIATQPLWYERMEKFLHQFAYYNPDVSPSVATRGCAMLVHGYMPNRYETLREWYCQSDILQCFHTYTERIYIDGPRKPLQLTRRMQMR